MCWYPNCPVAICGTHNALPFDRSREPLEMVFSVFFLSCVPQINRNSKAFILRAKCKLPRTKHEFPVLAFDHFVIAANPLKFFVIRKSKLDYEVPNDEFCF